MRVALAVLMLALAGCGSDSGDSGDDGDGGSDTTTAGSTTAQTTSRTTSAGGTATLSVDDDAGDAPFTVTFTVDADGNAQAWTLDFGDGSDDATGGNFPSTAQHTYQAGTYQATLTVSFSGGASAQDVVSIIARDEGQAPEVTHFEFGASLGCWKDITGTCVSIEEGPDAEPVDGFWIELGQAYWGLDFTSTVDHGTGHCTEGTWPECDSDCSFFDADLTEIGEANNGESACVGSVPANAAWLFLYPYGPPAQGMTLDFLL